MESMTTMALEIALAATPRETRETAGEEMEKGSGKKEREKKRTGTKCDSQRGRGARDPR